MTHCLHALRVRGRGRTCPLYIGTGQFDQLVYLYCSNVYLLLQVQRHVRLLRSVERWYFDFAPHTQNNDNFRIECYCAILTDSISSLSSSRILSFASRGVVA